MKTGARSAESDRRSTAVRPLPQAAGYAPAHGARHALPLGAGSLFAASLRLERRLAVGRMTEIWSGTAADGRPVAIKALKPDWLARPGARAVLQREHQLLGSLRHPNIVAAEACIDGPDRAALVFEFLGGGDLVSLAGAPARHWIASVRDVLGALQYLHGRGFAHRDVKARNVMFDGAGRARLIDFGSSARVGAAWTQHGTTEAHRPAQPRSGRVAAQQDLYAFAVLLYELLSGRLPFGAEPGSDAGANAPRPACEGENSPELAALGKLVHAALAAGGEPGIGTVSQFANVIESVLATESTQP